MAAGNTYEAIATQTLGSGATSVSFTSIPSTYTDLVFVTQLATATNDISLLLTINNDNGANYSSTRLAGSPAGATSSRGTATSSIDLTYQVGSGTSLNFPTFNTIHFMNYANTTTYKTILTRGGSTNNSSAMESRAYVSLWRNTAAINRLDIACGGANILTGSTFSLYGIKAA
jgi:hypothetical protein